MVDALKPDSEVEIQGKLTIDKKALKKNLKIALGSIGKFASRASRMIGLISAGALLKEGLETAIQQENRAIRINTLLRNRYGIESKLSEEYQSQAGALAKQSIFRKEDFQAAQESLLRYTETTAGIEAATKATELWVLATQGVAARASDFASAAKEIGQAIRFGNLSNFENMFSGEVGLTQEQIGYVASFSTEVERANALLSVMKENFSETANEANNSFAGSLKKSMSAMQDMTTSMAKNFLPALTKIFNMINTIIDALGGLKVVLLAALGIIIGVFIYKMLTLIPTLLGMGIAQAFAQGGIAGFVAGSLIAATIAGAIGIGAAGLVALGGDMNSKVAKKNIDAHAGKSVTDNQYKQDINIDLEAHIRRDKIDGVVTDLKRKGTGNQTTRYKD